MLITLASPAPATQLVNGNFSSGLVGWNVDAAGQIYPFGVGQSFVTTSGSQATINEDVTSGFFEVDLYQMFVVTGETTLSFDLTGIHTNTKDVTPAFFQAALVNPTSGASLVPTVDPSDPNVIAFYTHDLNDSSPEVRAASGVTVSPSLSTDAGTITVNIANLTNPTDAKILFSVVTGTNDTEPASASLTNVQLNGQSGPAAAPEPASAVLLLGLGLPLLMRYAWVRRQSRPHVA